ncbi:type IV inositol polyphosphate 5-phosphatase 7-like isoform X2 [Typha angustifolia]|uniref:type IV inositol polyphosphate 5-phosphatase 7-like isoform X2 n=1 Tax=Typha angustifolia TaxID=59011 RepID=UPI003C2C5D8F
MGYFSFCPLLNFQVFLCKSIFFSGGDGALGTSFSKMEAFTVKKNISENLSKKKLDRPRQGKIAFDKAYIRDTQEYTIFVSTWNVGGKSPPNCLYLEDWLHASPPADIFVLGFQEIVPLNAGNVLGAEDNGPANKWVALIGKTLNKLPSTCGYGSYATYPVPHPIVELDADFEKSTRRKSTSFFHRHSFQSVRQSLRIDGDNIASQPRLDRRFSVRDHISFTNGTFDVDVNSRWGGSSDEEDIGEESLSMVFFSPMSNGCGPTPSQKEKGRESGSPRYCLVARKQMVGIFLTIWVRSEIRDDVKNVKVSCVGRGLMGRLGNKGSISISMSLHQTTFCFICSHLTSGQKEGDELRRNSDVLEILRKTRFPQVHGVGDHKLPETILEHDRIIWLGDLNYRIALSYRTAKALIEMQNWKQLLDKDQLHIEQRCGRAFRGWKEGRICFPPTYKYSNNSDRYAGVDIYLKGKRRTPAWCDRILWYGKGLDQLSYVRGESRFSDHRPVYSNFIAEVETIGHSQFKKNMGCSSSRVEVEELLPYSHCYTDLYSYY